MPSTYSKGEKMMKSYQRAHQNFLKKVKAPHLRKLFNTLRTKFFRKERYKWMFGAWFGTRIGDNSFALLQQILKLKKESGDPFWQKLDLVWSCNIIPEDKIEGVRYVGRNTWEAMKEAATAQVLVFTHGDVDFINDENIYLESSYRVQLWHGVAWKKIGHDENSNVDNPLLFKTRRLLHNILYPERMGGGQPLYRPFRPAV